MVTAYQAVAQLRQHIRRDARLHGIITYGGAAANIVPDRTAGTFYVRAAQPKYLQELKERVKALLRGGRARDGLHADDGLARRPGVRSRCATTARWWRRTAATASRWARSSSTCRNASTGSTDMGNVSQIVPSIHPTFSVGQMIFNHTPEFTGAAITDAAHASMLKTAQTLAMTGVELALDPDLVRRAKADFAG